MRAYTNNTCDSGCMVAPLLILNQGTASCQNAEVPFAAYERLTIVLALHASNSIYYVTHAFAVLHRQVLKKFSTLQQARKFILK